MKRGLTLGLATLVALPVLAAPDGGVVPPRAPPPSSLHFETPTATPPQAHAPGWNARVTVGGLETGPGLDPQPIAAFLRARQATFLACYERMLRTNPSLSGHLGLRFLLGPEGRPMNLEVSPDADLASSDLGSCIKAVSRGWLLPVRPGQPTLVALRLSFARDP